MKKNNKKTDSSYFLDLDNSGSGFMLLFWISRVVLVVLSLVLIYCAGRQYLAGHVLAAALDPDADLTTEQQLNPVDPDVDPDTTEALYEYEDPTLLQHQYMDKYLSVVTSQDTYYLMIKMYNLQQLQLWTILAMFVIACVFAAFAPAYKVSKQ